MAKNDHKAAIYELLVHASIGLIVAALVIALVEFRVRNLNRKEIEEYRNAVSENVWKAVSGKLVPPEVVHQIERALSFETARVDAWYTFDFTDAPTLKGMTNTNLLLVRRKQMYSLHKLDPRDTVNHRIGSSFDNAAAFEDTAGNKYPRFTNFYVNEKPVTLENTGAIGHDQPVGDDPVSVVIESEEIYPADSCQYYIEGSPIVGLTVVATTSGCPKLKVRDVCLTLPRNSKRTELRPRRPNQVAGEWEYAGAVLPGQGFSIEWTR